MSIKVMHVIFVLSTTAMSAGAAYWCDALGLRVYSLLFVLLALALPVYGVLFWRKLRKNRGL